MSPSSAAALPRRRRPWRLLLKLGWMLLLLAWALVLLAWMVLHWGILPRLDDWRPEVEALASRSLGVPVQIARIEWRGSVWEPVLELHQVVLRDTQQREALRLPRVSAALSMRAALAFRLRFEQVLIDQPDLEVRRDAQGHLRVAGLELNASAQGSTDTRLADWFFQQHEFAIRAGRLRWLDELRGAPLLQLQDVLLVVRNGLRRHELRLDATPPPAWGERFSLRLKARAPLLARFGDWARWSGSLFLDLPHAEVDELRRYVDLPFELDRGGGGLRAWVDFSAGQADAATLDFALLDVGLRMANELKPLDFERLAGRIAAERRPDGVQVAATGIQFVTGEGLDWPASRITLTWRQKPGEAAVSGGEFSADRLDLAPLALLAERLPIGRSLQHLLAETRPEGTVRDLSARWAGALDAPDTYQVKARLQSLTLASAPAPEPRGIGRPGWRNADVQLQASETGGQAQLMLANGALELPGVFEQALVPMHRLNANLEWRIAPTKGDVHHPSISLRIKDARFANDDAQGDFSASWRTGTGNASGFGKGLRLPGLLELDGRFQHGRASAVPRYLPLGLHDSVRDYVRRAVQGGQVPQVAYRLHGDLWDFPFVHGLGEFHLSAQLRDFTLAYVPDHPANDAEPAFVSPWPAFSQVGGELVFSGQGMQVKQAHGTLWGLELREVNGGIRDLAQARTLELEGHIRGPAADMLRFVNATPISNWTQGVLAAARVSGPAELKLALKLPLPDLAQSTVKGSAQLGGGDLRWRPDLPLLTDARGRVDFDRQGVQVVGATARALGGEVSFEGGTQPEGGMRFSAQGVASAQALRGATELDPLPVFAKAAEGSAAYRLSIDLSRGRPEIVVTSPLVGMAIDLPAPLGKLAETALPLRYESTLELPATQPQRERLSIELGSLLQAQYLREDTAQGLRVISGAVGVGTALPQLSPSVHAVGDFGTVSMDAWNLALERLLGAEAGRSGATRNPYQPSTIALKAQSLLAFSRRINQVVLGLNRLPSDNGWRGNIDAEQLGGYFEYTEPSRQAPDGRVYARLARLSLPPAEVAAVESLLEPTAQVPALDIQVEDFELRGRKLGQLQIDATHRSAADGRREWRLNRLDLHMPEAHLAAIGQWRGGASQRRTALDFRLDVSDGGALLQRLGFGKLIRGTKGNLTGQLSWQGSPLAFDIPTLEGQMALALDAGQFLKADAGAGRLLGVLSLQALPRRLALDFRDVFDEGFAFDHIGGDVRIEGGVAHTNNLRLRGVQAAALMEGQADIHRETQNLRVIVVPEINAGTASLVYAAINPAIGLGSFFAQWLLRGPLRESNTREFRITGPWDAPQVDTLERKPGQTAPMIDALPAPAPASAPSATPSATPAATPSATPDALPAPAAAASTNAQTASPSNPNPVRPP